MEKGIPCEPRGIRVTSRGPWLVAAAAAFVLATLIATSASAVDGSEFVDAALVAPTEAAPVEPALAQPAGEPLAVAALAAPASERGLVRIERAWNTPSVPLDERVTLARRASLEFGIWNLDAAARAVLAGAEGGDPIERARAAVRLAPDLPAGRIELARAIWLEGGAPMAALRAAFSALAAIPRHLEASLWFAGSLLYVLGICFVLAGLWCIALVGGAALPHAAHDLGDLLPGKAPRFARVALLAALLLVPVALGEGLLGLCAGLSAVGFFYGDLRQRLTIFLAASLFILGAHPTLQLAGSTLEAFFSDPVAEAAISTAQGFSHPVDQVRLEAAAASDPLAARALAMRARRTGTLGVADAHYQALLRQAPNDPVIANNAANVRLNLGHMESALELYRRSVALRPDPVVLFNLSQAHGRAFQMDQLSTTLSEAQRLDVALVAELTSLQGAEPVGFVVDQPLGTRLIWQRILQSTQGDRMAHEIRSFFAPGRLGSDSLFAIGVFGAILVVFGVLGGRVSQAHWCARCGQSMCARCDPERGGGRNCGDCSRLFHHSETSDRDLRLARIDALRARDGRVERWAVAASFLIPGVAGLLAKRPVRCLLGSFLAVLALMSLIWRNGVVPDPMVAGATAPLASILIATVSLLGYFVVVLLSLATWRNA
jgi:tetratricopeptide (TPR) repeat protein